MAFEYSKDIEKPPEYIDRDFLENVVECALRETNVKITKALFKLGSAVGDNFCSLIYRVKVHYELPKSDESGTLSVIVKCIPYTEGIDFLGDLQVFTKEKITFYEILPRLAMFIEPGERFGGRLYHTRKHPINCLAFEDLNECGFESASREVGLDEKQARLVMKRIGQFHAISMQLTKRDPLIIKHYNHGMLSRKALKPESFLLRFFAGNASALLDLISNWPDYAAITCKIRRYVRNLPDNLVQAQAPLLEDNIQVLNHGDLWVNNILFKYDKKRVLLDCIFLDYQMSVWTSPGIDLNYFLYTSLQLDVLKHKREELLKEYYSSFRAKLIDLKYSPVPSYQQICEEVRRRASYGFFANFGIYPMISQDKMLAGDSSLDNLANEEFAAKKMAQIFASKNVAKTLRYTLREFDQMGVWD